MGRKNLENINNPILNNDEQIFQIIEMWNNGDHSYLSISNKLNRPKKSIELKVLELTKAGLIESESLDALNKKVIDMWNSKFYTVDSIAESLDISIYKVKKILKNHTKLGNEVYSPKEELKRNILKMWNSGNHTYLSISKKLNLNEATIYRHIRLMKSKGLITFDHKKYISKKNQLILDMWNSREHTYESIGQKIGVSRERIRQILAKLKRKKFKVISVASARAGRRDKAVVNHIDSLNETTKEAIIQAYHDGISIREIARRVRHDVDDVAVGHFIKQGKKNNLLSYKLRVFGTIKNNRENPSEETLERERIIVAMRSKDQTLSQVATALGISKINVTRLIKNMKLRGIYVPNSRDSGNPLSYQEEIDRVDIIDSMLDEEKSPSQISKFLKLNAHYVNDLIYKHLVDKS